MKCWIYMLNQLKRKGWNEEVKIKQYEELF